ncbi:cytochrome c peroxidase [Spirosoma montaniterrae]|uniref:Cytochrome C peroxidase n=1 Tax=Spirosoma montaniterrae TaxID=1178516 RepID=A0A1P9WW76_9BACT|nr:cytochrome c peroxidase [Spirosoma montaniterrae]AQG79637.1 cytochrome C peroxidase [Spirosoma montaniterrae]
MQQSLKLLLAILVTTTLFVALAGMASRWSRPVLAPVEQTKARFWQDLQTLDSLTNRVLLPLAERSTSTDSLQRAFLACRTAYKRIEPFAEYYFPTTTRLVNGPPLPEIEVEETKLFEPGGLQVIEEFLYPTFDPAGRDELVREVRKLKRELKRYGGLWEATELTDAHVFDALRLAVFRSISLGISGFDTPLSRTAIPEAATLLTSVQAYLAPYVSEKPAFASLQTLLAGAGTYLRQHPDFDSFDRAHFITTYANPLSTQLLDYQKQLGILPFTDKRPLRPDAPTLFAANVFDPDAYATTLDARRNPAKVALGKRLFYDPVLSANGQRSCASCHQPDKAFTDGLVKNKTLTGQGLIGRNTPTLLNAALQAGQFYDLRTSSLEGQVFDVVHNTSEMRGSMERAAQELQRSPDYVDLFKKAFPTAQGAIASTHIQNALAAYERTLTSFDSRFDRYMQGEKTALSAEEIHGFNLFMGKAKCGICHFMPLFNGTVPPAYTDSESEVIGTPATASNRQLDPDLGRYAHTKLDPLKYAFKTPTVRNIARTAPYMHNGVYQTLEQVVDFYNQGGGNGFGFGLDNQTLPEDKLNLSGSEKKALVAFMKAL